MVPRRWAEAFGESGFWRSLKYVEENRDCIGCTCRRRRRVGADHRFGAWTGRTRLVRRPRLLWTRLGLSRRLLSRLRLWRLWRMLAHGAQLRPVGTGVAPRLGVRLIHSIIDQGMIADGESRPQFFAHRDL